MLRRGALRAFCCLFVGLDVLEFERDLGGERERDEREFEVEREFFRLNLPFCFLPFGFWLRLVERRHDSDLERELERLSRDGERLGLRLRLLSRERVRPRLSVFSVVFVLSLRFRALLCGPSCLVISLRMISPMFCSFEAASTSTSACARFASISTLR